MQQTILIIRPGNLAEGRCPFCGGSLNRDRCIHCARSADLESELRILKIRRIEFRIEEEG